MMKGGRGSRSHDFRSAVKSEVIVIDRSSESNMGLKPSKTIVEEENIGAGKSAIDV